MTDQARPGACSPAGGGTAGIEGLRVLYAEDHPAMQRAVGRLLRASGASVATAHDGLEAMVRAFAEPFDLVVLDLGMPRMNGFEAARALRGGGCRVPLVAVTGDAGPLVRANALAAGFDAVLPKPFGLSDLIVALQLVREGTSVRAVGVSRAPGWNASPP